MRQLVQNQKSGEISIQSVPSPAGRPGFLLVRNCFSLISAGTERTSVETAKASMVGKAKSRPDLVRQVMDNFRREGMVATYKKVMNRLDNLKELGYSSSGIVLESSVEGFRPGDRVACAGTAYHAEIVSVPKNLAVSLPDNVTLDQAAFTTIGAIALQGVRQADPKIGEYVVVIGLGLVGLVTVELLKANGCRVMGIDISPANFEVAMEMGCDECSVSGPDSFLQVQHFTRGGGADVVIITASTKSNEPIESALLFARKKSKVVVVGNVRIDVPRTPFYEKELDLRISCSYGPGRYDKEYEENGRDYPYAYVRWTENRNMEAFLDLVSQGKIDMAPLITHRIPFQDGLRAYDLITAKKKVWYIGILLDYGTGENLRDGIQRKVVLQGSKSRGLSGAVQVGFVGAGNFAQSTLLPILKRMQVNLNGVVTSNAVHGKTVATKFGFAFCSTDPSDILKDDRINTVFVATRHDSHARYVLEALKNRKHVFVEKPLGISLEEVRTISDAYGKISLSDRPFILAGFNRRFSAPIRGIKEFFGHHPEPLFMGYRVNAGYVDKLHWTHKSGGRIVGEVCHFIDTMQYLTGSSISTLFAESLSTDNSEITEEDNAVITLKFDDGSVGTLTYLANGNSRVQKERLEVYSGGKTAIMDDFKKVYFYSGRKIIKKKFDGRKGHKEELENFIGAVSGKVGLEIGFDSICETTVATLKILESLRTRLPVNLS